MKKVLSFLNKYNYLIIPGILGVFVFIFLFGVDVLNPTNVDWLTDSGLDLSQHYVGWEFYRRSPWTINFGMNYLINYPSAISVIFTDSIPILAFIFKIFSNILPEYFNYFGMYGLLCYILQGVASGLILKKFIKEDYLVIILSVLFLFSPIMHYRMFYHTALSSHYLILFTLALALYKDKLSTKKYVILWGILGFITPLIHMYFLLMEGIILIGATLYEFVTKKNIKKMVLPYISFIGCGALAVFLFGGFQLAGIAFNSSGFGTFNANMMSLFTSIEPYSKYLTINLMEGNQTEGFGYLGLGGIFICILAIIFLIIKRKKINFKIVAPIVFTCIFAYIMSIVGPLWLLNINLGTIKLMFPLNKLLGMFISNGRLIWISHYIVLFLSIYILYKVLKKKWFIPIICLAFILQYNDFAWIEFQYNIDMSGTAIETSVQEKLNMIFDLGYKHLVRTHNISTYIAARKLDFIAMQHGMDTNYFQPAQAINQNILEKNLLNSLDNLSEDSIYMFSYNDFWYYKREGLNYYLLDNIIIGSIKEIDFLEKFELSSFNIDPEAFIGLKLGKKDIYEFIIKSKIPLTSNDKELSGFKDNYYMYETCNVKEEDYYKYCYFITNNEDIFINNSDYNIFELMINKVGEYQNDENI